MGCINFSSCLAKISTSFFSYYEGVISNTSHCLARIFGRFVTANAVKTNGVNLEARAVKTAIGTENTLSKKMAVLFKRFCGCFDSVEVVSSTLSERSSTDFSLSDTKSFSDLQYDHLENQLQSDETISEADSFENFVLDEENSVDSRSIGLALFSPIEEHSIQEDRESAIHSDNSSEESDVLLVLHSSLQESGERNFSTTKISNQQLIESAVGATKKYIHNTVNQATAVGTALWETLSSANLLEKFDPFDLD